MYVNYVMTVRLHLAIFREKRDGPRSPLSMLQNLDRTPPSLSLAIVDLPKVEHVPLRDTAARNAMIFDDAPIAVLFAVLEPPCHPQKHAAYCLRIERRRKGVGLHYSRFWAFLKGTIVDLKRLTPAVPPHFCGFGG